MSLGQSDTHATAISETAHGGEFRDGSPCAAVGSPTSSGTHFPQFTWSREQSVPHGPVYAIAVKRVGIPAICAALLALPPAGAQPADCLAERSTVQQERNLVRKRDLLYRALALCPQDPYILFEKGFTEERLRNYAQALEHYSMAVEIDDNYARAHFGRADVLMILEDYASAIEAYEKGLALNPHQPRAQAALERARELHVPPPAITPSPAVSEEPSATSHEHW